MRIKLDIPLRLEEVARVVRATLPYGMSEKTVTHITLNSKAVRAGDLFIALNGEKFRGSDFAEEAFEKGSVVMADVQNENRIYVENGKTALGQIASLYKSKLNRLSHTVMITGSIGKSTTKNFCKKILSSSMSVHATEGNLNNDVGLPITLLRTQKDCECLILEAGMNSRGEISHLSKTAKPDVAVITNIGRAHVGKLGSMEEIAKAKLEITDGLHGELILPYGEPLLQREGAKLVSYGNTNGNYAIIPTKIDSGGSSFSFFKEGLKLFDGRLNIIGAHFLKSLAFALSVADSLGIITEDICRGVEKIGFDDVRSRIIDFKDFSLFDDSYNASPESVLSALDALSLFDSRPKSALIGDMLELGDEAGSAHEEIGKKVAAMGLKRLFLIGEYCEHTERGAKKGGMDSSRIFKNYDIYSPEITARQIISNHEKSEIVLLKASHAIDLSRIADYIKILEG